MHNWYEIISGATIMILINITYCVEVVILMASHYKQLVHRF